MNESKDWLAEPWEEAPLERSALPEWNARFLKRRFTGAFSAIVSTRKDDGRIHIDDLAGKLAERTNCEWLAKLKRYLRPNLKPGSRPGMLSAWTIGETLRVEFGINWVTGLWMVYAAGRLEDFVGILSEFIDDSIHYPAIDNHAEMQLLWRILACIEDLTKTSKLDAMRDIAMLHLKADPTASCEFLTARQEPLIATPFDFVNRPLANIKSREKAKQCWLDLVPLLPRFQEAFNRWQTLRRNGPRMSLMDGALAVAGSPHFDIISKEQTTFKIVEYVLARWIDSDDVSDEIAFERGPPPRYWRAIHLRGKWY